MKEIQLSQFGKHSGKYVALVDDEDFESLNQYKWYAKKSGKTLYAVRKILFNGKHKRIMMHCKIMNGKGIDHKDHNGLNNQKANLRFCTLSENAMNRRKMENTSSAYKGVSLYKRDNNWLAKIHISGKTIHIGLFAAEVEAAKAYNAKAIELFGEFANLNNIN